MPEQYMYETRLIWHGKSVQGTGFFRYREPAGRAGQRCRVSIVTKELFQKLLTQEEEMELSEALSEGMINNGETLLFALYTISFRGRRAGLSSGNIGG